MVKKGEKGETCSRISRHNTLIGFVARWICPIRFIVFLACVMAVGIDSSRIGSFRVAWGWFGC